MLQTGDILFCKSNSWISRTIRRVTGSEINHVALVLFIDDVLFIVDSQSDGTRLRSFEDWREKYKYSYFVGRNSELVKKINVEFELTKYINKKYGYIDLVRHYILIKTGLWLGTKREDNRLVCSEFVMRMYGNPDAYKMNPKDVYIWCTHNDFIFFNP